MAQDFLYDYFIYPISQNGWYNPANTVVYGMLLIIGVYVVFRMLRRLDIRIDRHFLYAILPFIFWGSSTRVLKDAAFAGKLATPWLNAFYDSALFPTPGSYIITFGLALATLLLSLLAQRYTRAPYWKVMASIGIALCAINAVLLPPLDAVPFLLVAGFCLPFVAAFRMLGSERAGKRFKQLPRLLSRQNQVILGGHMFDASATFVSLSFFGYWEQHVLPNAFIPLFGPGVMFVLKIAVVLPVLWVIDKYGERGDFNNFLKIVVFILGIAPGIRDVLRLMAMV